MTTTWPSLAAAITAARTEMYAELVEALAETLPGVQVSFGVPDAPEENEVVALTGVENATAEARQLGHLSMEAEFGLTVVTKVHAPADVSPDPLVVDARGFEVAGVVSDVAGTTRANLTLGGTLRTCQAVSLTTDGVQRALGGGLVIFLSTLFECKARVVRPS